MKQIPIDQDKIPVYNKKAIRLILILMLCGVVTGLILSNIFINEANYRIKHPEKAFHENYEGPRPGPFPNNNNWTNFSNMSHNFPYMGDEPLSTYEQILPTFGVIIVCISTYLLIGLIAIYIKIFLTTNSKYITGLLFFLIALLIKSVFLIDTMRHLFDSGRIAVFYDNLGFGWGGLGGILVIVSFFEIIGLSILLYLSSE